MKYLKIVLQLRLTKSICYAIHVFLLQPNFENFENKFQSYFWEQIYETMNTPSFSKATKWNIFLERAVLEH